MYFFCYVDLNVMNLKLHVPALSNYIATTCPITHSQHLRSVAYSMFRTSKNMLQKNPFMEFVSVPFYAALAVVVVYVVGTLTCLSADDTDRKILVSFLASSVFVTVRETVEKGTLAEVY